MKSVYAVYSRTYNGHCDCLLLCKAEGCSDAILTATENTNILDLFGVDDLCAECLDLECKNDNYIKIFADDIYFTY